MTQRDTVSILKQLVDLSEDSEKGFVRIAGAVTNPDLRGFFQRRSTDCAIAATELKALVQSLGGLRPDGRAVSAAARPGWNMPRTTLKDADLTALKVVEDAEDKAEAAYVAALAVDLPHQIRSVLQRQHNSAVHSQTHIHELRISYTTAQPVWPETGTSPAGLARAGVAATAAHAPSRH
jgi:uncharacterized protein (TIGR02284 family)